MQYLPRLLMILALILGASAREAAPQGSRRSSGGGDRGGDSSTERAKRADKLILWFDTNRDGVIEPNEVHGQRRYVYERMAKEAGLDPTHSVSVGELRTAVARHFEKAAKVESKSTTPASKDSPKGKDSKSGGESPSVGGFGTSGEKPAVAGFAAPGGTGAATSKGTAPSQPKASGFSSSSSPKNSKVDSRVRKYAASLLKRYDANKNGVLEKDEWKKMRGSPEQGDANRDGVITLDELTARLASYGRKDSSSSSSTTSSSRDSRSKSGSSSGRPRWGSSGSSSSAASGDRKSYRFLSPTERLPKGLPDWFARKDADGDGQVSMAEFSTSWDDAKVSEFEGYDGNRDGVITPQECLDAENAK